MEKNEGVPSSFAIEDRKPLLEINQGGLKKDARSHHTGIQ